MIGGWEGGRVQEAIHHTYIRSTRIRGLNQPEDNNTCIQYMFLKMRPTTA